jgi:arylsulfatase A-like enzyme
MMRRPLSGKKILFAAAALGILLGFHGLESDEANPHKPNVVVILADDLGWGSLGSYGGTGLNTPRLDRLASQGRRFTNAYAPGSTCSPTRYAVMTGRYYWRTSIKSGGVLPFHAPLHIETHRVTLASLFQDQGYRTAAFGKWHLGLQTGVKKADWNQPLEPGPLAVGFDYFFGLAASPWSGPHTFIENGQLLGRIPGQPVAVTGTREQAKTSGIREPYAFDRIMESLTTKVTGWIKANHGQPFFVYFAPTAVHRPVAPNPRFTGSPFGKYGDFIHELDWSVGQILDTLDNLALADDTLVIFTSDNGGAINPFIENFATAIDAGLAINGALRGGKLDIWEGGFREPFIVRWPSHVPAGTTDDDIISLSDILATLASILHVPIPAGNAEDSRDVISSWLGTPDSKPARDVIVLQSRNGVYAIRHGPWKLIERENPPAFEVNRENGAERVAEARRLAPQHDELFNLIDDPGETRNVAAQHPEIVQRLRTLLAESRR